MNLHTLSRSTVHFAIPLSLVLGVINFAPQTLAQPATLQPQLFVGVAITAAVGTVHSIQFTTNLTITNWNFLTFVQLTNNPHLHIDTTTPARESRFYRTVAIAPASFDELQLLPDRERRFFQVSLGLPELVRINPGTFIMGSPTSEPGRGSDEAPQTGVTLTHGFYLGKYEITQAEYAKVMSNNPAAFPTNPDYPVEMVSWTDATTFATRLTQRESTAGRLPAGWTYRLPTEAEWEYACRAGTTTRYSFGDDLNSTLLTQYAWYGEVDTGRPRPVGTKLPNPWGLHDMHGNVWEHCRDALTYTGGNLTDPVGTGTARMTRGGSWHSLAPRCRSAARNPYTTTIREPWVGFRIALAPPDITP